MNLKPSEVMVPAGDYPVVNENDSISRAADILVSNFREKDGTWIGYESLFVKNTSNEVVGLLTLRSFLKVLGLNETENLNVILELFLLKNKKVSLRVKNFMQSLDERIINLTDDLDRAVDIINNRRVNSVIVVDRSKVVGVIRAIDLFWFIEEMV